MQLTDERKTAMKAPRRTAFLSLTLLAVLLFWFLKHAPFDYREVQLAFEKDRGINAVPGEVAEMKKIAQRRQDQAYSLSEKLRSDALINQRSTEFLYPVRIEKGQTLVFTSDSALAGCSLVDKEITIFLYDCPNPS